MFFGAIFRALVKLKQSSKNSSIFRAQKRALKIVLLFRYVFNDNFRAPFLELLLGLISERYISKYILGAILVDVGFSCYGTQKSSRMAGRIWPAIHMYMGMS